jgi:SET domain-containing protein
MNWNIEMKRTRATGRGVFATHNFAVGDTIEIAPVIRMTPKERKRMEGTIMDFYIYPWKSTRSAAVVLGFGCLYNHSFEPNADWKQDYRSNQMVYKAIKPIKKGEEILVNYNGEPDDTTSIDWVFNQPHEA